jgi:predicted nucleic acid-binding protein
VIETEISKIPEDDKGLKVIILSTLLKSKVVIDGRIEKRAMDLEELGFKSFDALHIACAEKGKADVFLTTDDSLLQKALQNKTLLKVRVANPVRWLMEVIKR